MMQLELMRAISTRTPLCYFGGKRRAVPVLSRFIPTSLRELVSPFFGSGALELALTGRGLRIYGYDKFPPIAHFWNTLPKHSKLIVETLRGIIRAIPVDSLYKWAIAAYPNATSDALKASLLLLIFNCSYNARGFKGSARSGILRKHDWLEHFNKHGRKWRVIDYARIADYYNPLVSVGEADFREALSAHPDTFSYLDPPYPDAGQMYGDAPEYHRTFPHDDLAGILHHRDNWVLSYNAVDRVRALYPPTDFDWYHVTWQQASRGEGRMEGNDVVITPKGQSDCPLLNQSRIH